jgi:hypothetical protein
VTRIYAPDPEDVPVAPELPTLSVLDAALNATIDILHLQHDMVADELAEARLARELVLEANTLRELVRRYAAVVLDE